MAVTPNTDLYLLQCPIELDERNQINFSSAEAQFNYFINLPKLEADNFTYQRKDNIIRFPAHIDSLLAYTYVMYRNTNYGSKWFYAYITDMQYINDNMTAITIETDVWQTWCFNISIKKSFVEREHVSNDAIGAHTIDEGLSTGEPILNSSVDVTIASPGEDSQRIVAQVTELPGIDAPSGYTDRIYNGITQGCYLLVIPGYGSLQKFCKWYDSNGKKDAIVSMFIAPLSMVTGYKLETAGSGSDAFSIGFLPSSYSAKQMDIANVSYSSTLNGYTPTNKKLYTFPYSYLNVTNNAGSSAIFRYEDFSDPTYTKWNCFGVLSQGCQIKIYPTNDYKGNRSSEYASSYDYGISAGKLPVISWQSDYYLNWQAQNGANNAFNAGVSVLNGAMNLVSGVNDSDSTIGASVAGVKGGLQIASSIQQAIHEDRVASLVPEQALGNTNAGDINYSMGKTGFTFQRMSIRSEYAVIIDNYLSAFGYKVNSFKIPQFTSRRNWNFIRTQNIAIEATIPQKDLQEIKDIFDAGVTMWHNPSTFMDYSQPNNIV